MYVFRRNGHEFSALSDIIPIPIVHTGLKKFSQMPFATETARTSLFLNLTNNSHCSIPYYHYLLL